MFHHQPDNTLPPGLLTDVAARAYALALEPTIGASEVPAMVTAEVHGQGLFIRVLVDEDLPAGERELFGELARSLVVGLLRTGTGEGGWTWDASVGRWVAQVRHADDVDILVPDHVPEEWTRAA